MKYRNHRGTMMTGAFVDLVQSLNPRIRVFSNNLNRTQLIVGMYVWTPDYNRDVNSTDHRSQGNWRYVCRLNPGWLPERNVRYSNGEFVSHGWRELLNNLQGMGLIKIPAAFGGKRKVLDYGSPLTLNQQGPLVLSD